MKSRKEIENMFKEADKAVKNNKSLGKGWGTKPYFWRQCLGWILEKPEHNKMG